MKEFVCGLTFLSAAVICTAVLAANSGLMSADKSTEDASSGVENLPDQIPPNIQPREGGTIKMSPEPVIHPLEGGTIMTLPMTPPEPVNGSGVYSPWAVLKFNNAEEKEYYYKIAGTEEFKRLYSFEFIKQTCEIEAYYIDEYGNESSHIFLSYIIENPKSWVNEEDKEDDDAAAPSYQNKYAAPLTKDEYKEINFFDYTQQVITSFYISSDMYNAALADKRHYNYTFSDFIVDDVYDKELIGSIVESYTSFAEENGYSKLQTLNGLAALGQSAAEYGYDRNTAGVSGNYIRYGIESLCDPYIDCEDYAILIAELFKAAGYRSALFCNSNHAIAGVVIPSKIAEKSGLEATELNSISYNGDTFFLVEGTAPIMIGDVDLTYEDYQSGGEFIFYGEF